MKVLLGKDFWKNNDVLTIAEKLIGCELSSTFNGIETSGIIVETEAYRGRDDKACHAYNGRRTERTEVMYQSPGRAYIYLCYGIHHLLNFVCAEEGTADAVLIRAIEPLKGIETMAARRKMPHNKVNLTNGPGKLSVALGIHTKFSGISVTELESPIKCFRFKKKLELDIETSRRIGVEYAEECADWLWRFTMKGNKYVSKA